MNRRSFLWRGFGSFLPLVGGASFSDRVAAFAVSKPTEVDFTAFARGLAGNVFHSGDPKYEQLRKGYAAKYDAHPALVVHPVNMQDIQATLGFASSHQLPLAVRCGGHSYAGYSSCEGGVVVDMSGFRSIGIASDKGHVRIGGGMLCGAVEIETSKAGVAAVLGQCPSVGVGGYLLGGGVGPLMSKYGLGCDNILAADLVLADGRQVRADTRQNQDLYWAIRGGGGNFGIATAFEVALHPVSKVFAGNITLESADARTLLRAFSDFLPTAPDELTLIGLISAKPDHKPVLDVQACFAGGQEAGEKALAALRHHPAIVHDTVQLRQYLELEQMVPAEIPPSYEEHCSGFFTDLNEQRIEILAEAFSSAPIPVECFLVHLHGAVTRLAVDATPFPLRRAGITFDVAAHWEAPNRQRAASEWIKVLKSQLPVDDAGNYVNVMDREGNDSVRRAYGANYARLQQVKAQYDPHNLFALNQNIRPA
jgi:FAD binding domain/Berberine and berberine like